MEVINFQDVNCAHCYKCLRNCAVKAIRINNGQAQIVRELCIYCGHCMEICPQKAKTFESDLDIVKRMIANGDRVVASIDPSYVGLLGVSEPGHLVAALKKLGFAEVRDTAEAADVITREYKDFIDNSGMDNIITSSCPAVVYLIEKHYPMLIPFLAPVISPTVAHGKMIKKEEGMDTKVVYIGPCVAKKMEAEADPVTRGFIDGVIEFNELENWLAQEEIVIDECDLDEFANKPVNVNALYPVSRGIIRAVETYGCKKTYKMINVSTVASCREFLHAMKVGDIHNCFAELHLCPGGCVNGPGCNKDRGFRFKAQMGIEDNAVLEPVVDAPTLEHLDIERFYMPKQIIERAPSDYDIKRTMKKIGKSNSDTEFNCGACGYLTCRDMAKAIYEGKAEASMCLVRSFENARSQSNLVLKNAPSIIVVLDGEYKIKEFNTKAEQVFGVTRADALRMYMFEFIKTDEFEKVYKNHKSIRRFKKKWPMYNMTVLETIIYIEENDRLLGIIEDITEEENMNEKFMDKKIQSVKMAQSVVEKQMRAAQEIAGLLGETTAETKSIINQLRDFMLEDEFK